MKLVGKQPINAPRDVVYAALNDVDILRQSIPGCEEIIKISDTEMTAIVALKVGPVKAKFKGSVELLNLNPPESYTISGEGKGGPAGSAKGGADVKLVEDGQGTVLEYDVSANVMGKFAQLGNRLIDSTAKKLASQFFEKFGEIVEAQSGGVEEENANDDADDAEPDNSSPEKTLVQKPVFWIVLAAIAAVVVASQLL